jgi:hypothetical protein
VLRFLKDTPLGEATAPLRGEVGDELGDATGVDCEEEAFPFAGDLRSRRGELGAEDTVRLIIGVPSGSSTRGDNSNFKLVALPLRSFVIGVGELLLLVGVGDLLREKGATAASILKLYTSPMLTVLRLSEFGDMLL